MECTLRICETAAFRHRWNSECIRISLWSKRERWYARSSSWHYRCDSMCFFPVLFTLLEADSKRVSWCPKKYSQQKGLSLENCVQKMKAFVAFLSGERDALVSQAIDNALMICEKLEIPIEERRVRRKKRIPGEQTQDVGLFFESPCFVAKR